MIKGAYSDKYKASQNEQVERLREQARLEGKNVQDRVKELSKETNRRRRALENKKKQLEEQEEKQREELLAERRKLKDEATQKFQKEALHKKKTRPNSRKESTSNTAGSPQLQDGVRIVRGHVVEIKDGQQIPRTAPTLEDALKLVNSPYQDVKDHEIQYYGPKDMYQDVDDDHTKIGTLNAPIMNQGQLGTLVGLSGVQGTYYEGNNGNQGNFQNGGNQGYYFDHEEQIKLRESALQNGGPKFAFMNEEWTDGALPQTMGRDSPAGSLTSLDSLDEVPSDNLLTKDTPCPAPSVAGIIVKESRTKSAPRRRVTFSDSIEFDDGLTGQLVTAEKASCKQYVKLYNSRIAANNAYNASVSNAHRPTAPCVKGVHTGVVAGTPGSTPMKSNGPPIGVSLQCGSSASMIVPKSICSQIPFSGNTAVATTGEVTSSSMTNTDHPVQCIAQAEPRTPSAPRPPGQYGTSNLGTREMDTQDSKEDQDNRILEVRDSLDIVGDSLEFTEESARLEHSSHEENNDSLTEGAMFESNTQEDSSNECRENFEPAVHEGTQNEFHHVDYYGNPTNIYRNPFGQKISTEEGSQTFNTTTANLAASSSSTKMLTTSSGSTHALASTSAGQHAGAGHGRDHEQDSTQEKVSKSKSRESNLSSNDSVAKNPAYYRSWYPGSFFPSRPNEDRDQDVNGDDDEVFEQAGYTKKNNSVAFNIMDENSKQRKDVMDARQMSQRNKTMNDQGTRTDTYNSVLETRGRDLYGTGYNVTNPPADYATSESKRTASVQTTPHPRTTSRTPTKESNNSDNKNRILKDASPGDQGMTAKPPHPSTRHKGVFYSSPLHRKRAAAAVRRHTGKTSPRGVGRKTTRTVIKKKDDPRERNVGNQKNLMKDGRKNGTKEAAGGVSDDDDEMIQSIKRDMERISMRCNASPAQEEHQNIIRGICSMRGHVDSPLGVQAPDQTDSNPNDAYTKSDFRTVYRKVHQPRVGSAKPRGQKMIPNKAPPSRIPTYVGTSSNGPSRAGEERREDGSGNTTNPALYTSSTRTWSAENELLHPQTTSLKRSISLDKTPTDDEINVLWDRVRNCLNHKDAQSVGSDSCVNRIDVRRSQTKQFIPQGSQDHTLRDSEVSRDRSSSIAGMGTIGGLRRYGSYEVLRRYGSADNLGYRPQPLLQHRALRTRQSGQGKPPIVPRQQTSFTPMASRQAPSISLSTRAAPIPLTQTELRAVMKASQQTQEHLFRQQYETTPDKTQGYQHLTRKAPSALSIEEHRLLESLDRLNERLKVQEAITANLSHKRTHSANPSTHPRPESKQRASSSTYRYK